ncbi:MAG: hypothetical protein ACYDCK_12245 [Thermoplasmatota archaeon]
MHRDPPTGLGAEKCRDGGVVQLFRNMLAGLPPFAIARFVEKTRRAAALR